MGQWGMTGTKKCHVSCQLENSDISEIGNKMKRGTNARPSLATAVNGQHHGTRKTSSRSKRTRPQSVFMLITRDRKNRFYWLV